MKIRVDYDKVTKHVELTDELVEPCPFCGSKDIALCNTHNSSYWMECQNCDAQVHGRSFVDYADGNKDYRHIWAARSALDTWNHRSTRGEPKTTFDPSISTVSTGEGKMP